MADWSPQDVEEVLKILYPKGVSDVLAPSCELYRRLKKNPKSLRGKKREVPIVYAGAGGVSSDFSSAKSTMNPAKYKSFEIPRRKIYALGQLTGEWLAAAQGEEASLVDGLREAMDRTAYSLQRAMAAYLYGDGTGVIGEIDSSSNVATATIKLKNPTEALRFEEGMVVQAWDGSSSTPRDSGATAEIVAVDPDAGTITANGNWSTLISGIQVGDKLLRKGDLNNVGMGLAGWLPTTAPTSGDNFFGVDRSANPNRLAGVRVNGSGGSIDEVLIAAANRVALYGGRPDVAFLNHLDFSEIAIARQSYLQIKDGTNKPTLGFESFKIMGPRGPIEVVPDADCPQGTAYLLTMSSWELGSAGDLPFLEQRDGMRIHRLSDDDGFGFEFKGYWNLYTNAPGHNAVITF